MKKPFILLFPILVLFACGEEKVVPEQLEPPTEIPENKAIEADLSKFEGWYYLAEMDSVTNNPILVENCWTKGLDAFEISEFAGSPGHYFFNFDGHHAFMYLMQTAKITSDGNLFFTGIAEDESSDEIVEYDMIEIIDDVYQLMGPNNEIYILIRKEHKNKYPYFPCQEREAMSDLDFQDEIVLALFALRDGTDKINELIPENGIPITSPGPGVSPIENVLTTKEEILATGLFNNKVFLRLMEYVEMHHNEERGFITYVNELPDRCQPGEEALYLLTKNLESNTEPATAQAMLVKYNDELEESYTYFMMNFKFDDKMKITMIDHTECGL